MLSGITVYITSSLSESLMQHTERDMISFFRGVLVIITLFCLLQNKTAANCCSATTAFLTHQSQHNQQRHHHDIGPYHPHRFVERRTTTFTTRKLSKTSSSSSSSSWLFPTSFTTNKPASINATKQRLLELILTMTTLPKAAIQEAEILKLVQNIETAAAAEQHITAQEILIKLQGKWELLWTIQDPQTTAILEKEQGKGMSRLNILENQRPKVVDIMSNNNNQLVENNDSGAQGGGGGLQVLQTLASLVKNVSNNNKKETKKKAPPRRSTQEISLVPLQLVRNIAYYNNIFSSSSNDDDAISITVDIEFQFNEQDPRRVDVEFTSCRVIVPQTPIDFLFPLQIFSGGQRPKGWLRTTYVDDNFRITRGHKGSIFILCRPT